MNIKFNPLYFAIGLIWLFHLSGIIGISIGFEQWFVPKTSLNLVVLLLVTVLFFPLKKIKSLAVFAGVAVVGFIAEALGVNFGWFFGDYSYGDNLGPKLLGVPLLIGINWGILSLISANLAEQILTHQPKIIKSLIGATLMLVLDIFMEHSAPRFDFWAFTTQEVPIDNYIAWFLFAFAFNWAILTFKVKGNFSLSLHIYIVQLLFFVYFYVYF